MFDASRPDPQESHKRKVSDRTRQRHQIQSCRDLSAPFLCERTGIEFQFVFMHQEKMTFMLCLARFLLKG